MHMDVKQPAKLGVRFNWCKCVLGGLPWCPGHGCALAMVPWDQAGAELPMWLQHSSKGLK